MRKRLLLSLMTIAAVATIIGFGSWAVFNDTESPTDGSSIGAGTLDLAIGNPAEASIEQLELKPSEWVYLKVDLVNIGENDGILDLHFKNIVDSDRQDSEPECAAEWGHFDSTRPDGQQCTGTDHIEITDISKWIDVDWCLDRAPDAANGVRDCDGPIIGKLGDIESQVIDLELLAEGEQVELWLSFHIQTDAGNEHQGDVTAFDIEFTLHQVNLAALGLPSDYTCIRLEDKTAASGWKPIVDNDLRGSVCYSVGSDLSLDVEAHGLKPNTTYQLSLNGQGGCLATDDPLASGATGGWAFNPLFIAGYRNGGPNLATSCGSPGEGIYNYAYVTSDGAGNLSESHTIVTDGANWPGLPSGTYNDVKFVVKEVTGAMPGTAWDPILMEMMTLDFMID